jgi:predicted TIM-barrel fold metal-dependent hydrolase
VAIGEGLADANPVIGTNKATEEVSRDRGKMLFGSDFPLIAPDRWIADFRKATFRPEVQDLILKQNAIRALGLSPKA